MDEVCSDKQQPRSENSISNHFWKWFEYDENDVRHRLVRNRHGVEHEGRSYIPLPLPAEYDPQIDNFYYKHQRFPKGITLRFEGPDKAIF